MSLDDAPELSEGIATILLCYLIFQGCAHLKNSKTAWTMLLAFVPTLLFIYLLYLQSTIAHELKK